MYSGRRELSVIITSLSIQDCELKVKNNDCTQYILAEFAEVL